MRKTVSYLLCAVLGILVGLTGFKVFLGFVQYQESAKFYDTLVKEVVTPVAPQRALESTEQPKVYTPWNKLITVDLESLQETNPDVVGWVFFEDIDISYPVVHSRSNTKYLYKLYNGTENNSGSIILESTNSPFFTDKHSILYGHNMKDLSMFGKLKFYQQKKGYLKKHKFFQVFTNTQIYRFQIVKFEETTKNSKLYQTQFEDSVDFNNFRDEFLAPEGVKVPETPFEQWVTLSTCYGGNQRFTVTAVCVDTIGRIP